MRIHNAYSKNRKIVSQLCYLSVSLEIKWKWKLKRRTIMSFSIGKRKQIGNIFGNVPSSFQGNSLCFFSLSLFYPTKFHNICIIKSYTISYTYFVRSYKESYKLILHRTGILLVITDILPVSYRL